ncbi:MAG: 30S ribosomal protein S4e [Candidatus Diapherotrites archaeon]|nr:30S ribosomal protein S4e [Candidatus Diapherotrites archaeon]
MGNAGERKRQKRISAPKVAMIKRKENTWTFRIKAGKHKKNTGIPLGLIVRDYLGFAETAKESLFMINNGYVLVDGKTIKGGNKYITGLFDVISFPEIKKNYRIVFDKKGRLIPLEIKDLKDKICKITNKTQLNKDTIQITLNDSRNIRIPLKEKDKYKVGGSVKISLPEGKINEIYELKEGNISYVIHGKHAGSEGKLVAIVPATMTKPAIVKIASKEAEFETTSENTIIIGKTKPEVELFGGK